MQGCADGEGGGHIFKLARKLIKSQPCCKRNGNSIFRDLFLFSNSGWSNGPKALCQ